MEDPSHYNLIDAIRKRPAMYVGSTDFFGFIHYLVCPVAMVLARKPSWVRVAVEEGVFTVEADVAISLDQAANGGIEAFEEMPDPNLCHDFEGCVLNMLSETLAVESLREGRRRVVEFRRGVRDSYRESTIDANVLRTTMTFVPDESIFLVTSLSPAIFESYLRRNSFLHRGVRFSLEIGGETRAFVAEGGIFDLFTSVSAPYQILHEPIRISGEHGPLRLEAVYACHSWKEPALWCFINNGRAAEGGTHEQGVRDALLRVDRALGGSKMQRAGCNGVVGIVSIHYPDTVWEGCIKAKIGNPELRPMVRDLFADLSLQWLRNHPETFEDMQKMTTFTFPEIWPR